MSTSTPSKAKLFSNVPSQAVRLPIEFRLFEALDEFESGLRLERDQPAQTDQRLKLG